MVRVVDQHEYSLNDEDHNPALAAFSKQDDFNKRLTSFLKNTRMIIKKKMGMVTG